MIGCAYQSNQGIRYRVAGIYSYVYLDAKGMVQIACHVVECLLANLLSQQVALPFLRKGNGT